MKNNILPRTCRECGSTFLGGPRAWYCPACRIERIRKREKEYRERKKAGKTVPVGSIIKCELCGKEIIKNGGPQRFCPECAAKHLKEVDNQQSLEWKRANPEKMRESKRKISKERHATGERFESGVKGVHWDKAKKKWIVRICFNGKQYRIAQVNDKNDAIKIKNEFASFVDAYIKSLIEHKSDKNKAPEGASG